ncbi:MAG: hypothetical protein HYU66_25850 [Armatimonadetes bacterium]|nr:hypothetical protein [Armatimonadota bacterium]
MALYALCLAAPQKFDAQAIARVVAEVCGRTQVDAMHQLYHGRGLLADRLPAEQAQELGRRLAEQGLNVFAVPETGLLPVPRPRPITTARVRPAGLEIEDQLHRLRVEPWDGLRLVALAVVEHDRRELSPLERAHRDSTRPGRAPRSWAKKTKGWSDAISSICVSKRKSCAITASTPARSRTTTWPRTGG